MPYIVFDTTIGPTGVAWNDVGITALQLPEATAAKTRARLVAKSGEGVAATERSAPAWVRDAVGRVRTHLRGEAQDLTPVRLDFARVAPFTARVYEAARRVGPGTTVSYGELALAAGSPGAARAVGRAMATNPFPIVVPCHRVLAAGGKPGGFSAFGGVVTKDRLLAIEKSPVRLAVPTRAARKPASAFDAKAAIRHLSTVDPVLGRHIARLGKYAFALRPTKETFDSLAEAIVYQQLSGKAAATIFGRVLALYPDGRLDPPRLHATPDESLRAAGLSRAKVKSLRDLAVRADAGEVPSLAVLATMDDDAIIEALTRVRGIGRWTVEMLLMFRLGRPDVLPLGDFGIRKGFAKVFRGRRDSDLASPAEIAKRGERWRPYRSVASWYLWRVLEVKPT